MAPIINHKRSKNMQNHATQGYLY